MLCDRKLCTKAYHLGCLGLGKRPFGRCPSWDAALLDLFSCLSTDLLVIWVVTILVQTSCQSPTGRSWSPAGEWYR